MNIYSKSSILAASAALCVTVTTASIRNNDTASAVRGSEAVGAERLSLLAGSSTALPMTTGSNMIPRIIGKDTNIASNPFIQPQDPALAGNGRDQTQKGFDFLIGDLWQPSVIVGRLGPDLMIGGPYVDVLIGGPEHFNPSNRDKAFGLDGDDIFLWSPGDGSDRFEGGAGVDTVVFGLIGEGTGYKPEFKVHTDQKAGVVFFDQRGLPVMDVTNSPGFCEIVDGSTSANAKQELANINADHLARFVIRGVRNAFEAGQQKTDNGLRVTLTLKDVEFVVCADRAGGKIEVLDLRYAPARKVSLNALPTVVQWLVR